MGSVREILDREPPKTLYHYTTSAGLLGIINSREIWATHTQYLNDVREFHHAIDIVRAELLAMQIEANDKGQRREKRLLEEMQEGLEGIESINVCVASFSELGDSLSQWRAYGGGSGGFAIGFSGEFLRAILGDMFWLVPCVYDQVQQHDLVRALIGDVLNENIEREDSGDKDAENWVMARRGGNLVAYLNRYAPILKHQSFQEEQEWRLLSRPLMCVSDRFGYRPGPSMLVPYYRIPLFAAEKPFGIREIVVGPTPHPKQSISSVQSLLVRHDLTTRVTQSETPYRNW